MSNSVKMKNDNVRLTRLQLKNQKENVQELGKTAKSLGRIANEGACEKAKQTTAVSSKSSKHELDSSPEQLDILSVKENNGQIVIEYRAPGASAPSMAGTDEMHTHQTVQEELAEIKVEDQIEFGEYSISVQSIPGGEQHNYPIVHCESTAIKVKNEVDIEMEDETECCALSSIAQSILATDDKEHNNKITQDKSVEIQVDEIEVGEPSVSVQPISTFDDESRNKQTVENELTKNEGEMEFCDEAEKDALNNAETTVPDKPGELEVNKKKSEFICDICSKKCSSKKLLAQHRKRHGKPKLNALEATIADKPSASKKNKHLSEFICDICSKKCSSRGCLVTHRKRHGKPKFRCTVCGVSKFRQFELDKHMRKHDRSPIDFKCDLCPIKLSSVEDLAKHRRRHGKPQLNAPETTIADKPSASKKNKHQSEFICDICSKKYSSKRCLVTHRKRHGKPNFTCNVCGEARFRQCDIDVHMRKHDPNPKNFACDLCPIKLSSVENLQRHRKRHGKPKFHCSVCGVAKFLQFELDEHMRTHDPLYFKCDICPQKFASKAYLKRHRLRHGFAV